MAIPCPQDSQPQSESQESIAASRLRRAATYIDQNALPVSASLHSRYDTHDRRRDITQVLGDALSRILLKGSDAEVAAVERWLEHNK